MTTTFSTSLEQESLPAGWRWARLGDVCEINPSRRDRTGFRDDMPVTCAPMSAVDDVTGSLVAPMEKQFGEVKKGSIWFLDGEVLWAIQDHTLHRKWQSFYRSRPGKKRRIWFNRISCAAPNRADH